MDHPKHSYLSFFFVKVNEFIYFVYYRFVNSFICVCVCVCVCARVCDYTLYLVLLAARRKLQY